MEKQLNKLIFLVGLVLISCEKEELPVPPHEPGESQFQEVGIGADYGQQLYFDFETNSVIKSNHKTAWDLAFESASDGNKVILNSSRGMAVYPSEQSFAELNSTEGAAWRWDAHSGNLDSTGFGNISPSITYLVDMGYTPAGDHLGYRKVRVNDISETHYVIEWNVLSENTPIERVIEKDNSNLFTFLSFANGVVDIAPPNEDYDLVFTQYTHVFQEPETPYLVTGVLLNRFETKGILWEGNPFEEITLEDVESTVLTDDLNCIGYDWKYFDFESSMYTVDAELTFIVQTQTGIFYKLRFTGFYNVDGIKGYPQFEFQML